MLHRGLLVAAVCVAACASSPSGEDGPAPPPLDEPLPPPVMGPSSAEIDTYLRSLTPFELTPAARDTGTLSAARRDGDYSCATQDVAETRQYDRVVAYAASSDVLWPGALLQGDSLDTGDFTPAVFPRQAQRISISLESLSGTRTAVMTDPTLSSYREALAAILDGTVEGATPANLHAEIEQVSSSSALELALGARASWGGVLGSVAGSFDFNATAVRSRFVVRFVQSYYTVDVDTPAAPSAVFAPDVTLADVKAGLSEGVPPVYVSSITYGRMVVFSIESTYSGEEMGAALQMAFAGGSEVSGSVSVTHAAKLSQAKITAFILGGSGGEAARSITSYEDLIAFIGNGGDYSADSPGAPIAYKLRYLADNAPRAMALTTEYTARQCTRVNQRVRVTLQRLTIDDAGGDSSLSIYGTVSAATNTGGAPLFNRTVDQRVTIADGTALPPAGTLGVAEIDVSPTPGSAIAIDHAIFSHNTVFADDLFLDGSGNRRSISFAAGWNQSFVIPLAIDDLRAHLDITLKPI